MPTKRNQDLLDLRHHSDKKASKPLMEKRRRARINHSLAQLKALVIDPNTSERSRQTKLEKADILELTVRHLHEIKRQQRTAHLLSSRNPKKKFEIGYSECVREVELFLSNLITPENSGIDTELQKRLRDHLNKRLQDFKNIAPLDSNSQKELPEGEPSNDELSSSPSSSVSNNLEDLPLLVDAEETDSIDSSALNVMMKCYAEDDEKAAKRKNNVFLKEKLLSKRLKRTHDLSSEEATPFSCPSVTSTTGFKSVETALESPVLENCYKNVCINGISNVANDSYDPYLEKSDLQNTRSDFCIKTEETTSKRKSFLSTYLQEDKAGTPEPTSYSSSNEFIKEPKNGQFASSAISRDQKCLEQIPLIPRQLANGDWALVLPASLVPAGKEESQPFSAFRLVMPSNSSDFDSDRMQQNFHSSTSPLSSTVSDMSAEEFYSRSDGDPLDRAGHSSPDSTQDVWRPW